MMRVLALSYAPYGPCTAEREAAESVAWSFREMVYTEVDWSVERADVILNVGAWPMDKVALERSGCRHLVGYGVGTDYVDTLPAQRLGITIHNMPNALTMDVAVHALAMILSCVRRLPEHDRTVRSGEFDPAISLELRRPSAMTLGFLAFGNIPRLLARMAAPLGFKMIAHDPGVHQSVIESHGVTAVDSLDRLLSESDVLSVHVPGAQATRNLLGFDQLSLLPKGAILVATSRGSVIDQEAAGRLLTTGHLGAAAFDVFSTEPPDLADPLLQAPHTLFTPHVAGNTADSIAGMHRLGARLITNLAMDEAWNLHGLVE